MKKYILISIFAFLIFTMTGCGQQNLSYSPLYRDTYNTGGDLTFVYDENTHTASFGGEGEAIQFYNEDIAKGWKTAGNRVGVKLYVPKDAKNYQSASATIGDEKFEGGSFLKTINEEGSSVAEFYPIVNENDKLITLKISWEDDTNEQIYNIVVKEGTYFMKNTL